MSLDVYFIYQCCIFTCRKHFLPDSNSIKTMLALYTNSPSNRDIIKRTGALHERLCGIVDKLNECFSVQVYKFYFFKMEFY